MIHIVVEDAQGPTRASLPSYRPHRRYRNWNGQQIRLALVHLPRRYGVYIITTMCFEPLTGARLLLGLSARLTKSSLVGAPLLLVIARRVRREKASEGKSKYEESERASERARGRHNGSCSALIFPGNWDKRLILRRQIYLYTGLLVKTWAVSSSSFRGIESSVTIRFLLSLPLLTKIHSFPFNGHKRYQGWAAAVLLATQRWALPAIPSPLPLLRDSPNFELNSRLPLLFLFTLYASPNIRDGAIKEIASLLLTPRSLSNSLLPTNAMTSSSSSLFWVTFLHHRIGWLGGISSLVWRNLQSVA